MLMVGSYISLNNQQLCEWATFKLGLTHLDPNFSQPCEYMISLIGHLPNKNFPF